MRAFHGRRVVGDPEDCKACPGDRHGVADGAMDREVVGASEDAMAQFDIIGDVHGFAGRLRQLLAELGYRSRAGTWFHPDRMAIFVGDLIDRGPEIGETLQIVRRMVDGGHAQVVIGNHEFNLIAFHTPRPDERGAFLRRHTERNVRQHLQTLQQLSETQRRAALQWFRRLPPALELNGFRVVHACWSESHLRTLHSVLSASGGIFDDEAMVRLCRRGTAEFAAAEVVLKGPEVALPEGQQFTDPDGHVRRKTRVRWFGPRTERVSWRSLSFPENSRLPESSVPERLLGTLPWYGLDEPPVFVGHYWLPPHAPPHMQASNVCCVDYSVATGGPLAAYAFEGGTPLDPARLHLCGAPSGGRTGAAGAAASR